MCSTGKVRHNRRGALNALERLNNAGLNAYKCKLCHGWHLGNSREPWKQQARIDQLLDQVKKKPQGLA